VRYKVNIPKPSARRMECYRTLVIELHISWQGTRRTEHEIPTGVATFEFELNESILQRDPEVLDGTYHTFSVIYQNSTKSRKEEIAVTPIKE
jgi:hypothetical protein